MDLQTSRHVAAWFRDCVNVNHKIYPEMKVVLNKVYCILFYNTFQPKSKGFVQKIGFEICCKHVINHNSFPQHESCTQKKSCWHNNRLEASCCNSCLVYNQTMQLLHMTHCWGLPFGLLLWYCVRAILRDSTHVRISTPCKYASCVYDICVCVRHRDTNLAPVAVSDTEVVELCERLWIDCAQLREELARSWQRGRARQQDDATGCLQRNHETFKWGVGEGGGERYFEFRRDSLLEEEVQLWCEQSSNFSASATHPRSKNNTNTVILFQHRSRSWYNHHNNIKGRCARTCVPLWWLWVAIQSTPSSLSPSDRSWWCLSNRKWRNPSMTSQRECPERRHWEASWEFAVILQKDKIERLYISLVA